MTEAMSGCGVRKMVQRCSQLRHPDGYFLKQEIHFGGRQRMDDYVFFCSIPPELQPLIGPVQPTSVRKLTIEYDLFCCCCIVRDAE